MFDLISYVGPRLRIRLPPAASPGANLIRGESAGRVFVRSGQGLSRIGAFIDGANLRGHPNGRLGHRQ
jgi:hypothetical protein